MMTIWPLVVAIVLAFGAYGAKRLDAAAQPLRLELAEKAESLLAHPDLKQPTRGYVNFMLDTAFGMRGVIIVSIVLVPVFALIALVFPKLMKRGGCEPDDEALAARFYALQELHDRITLANHPFLIPILDAELSMMKIAWVVRASFDGVLPALGRNILLVMVERKTHRHAPTDDFGGVPA